MAAPTTPADSPPTGEGRFRFGAFEFDARTGELTRDGQPIKLQPQPARVLGLLVARHGEIVLREELKAHLWGQDTFVDFERGLNFCILQVRTALRDTSENARFVQTVPRKGYRFIAPVARVDHVRDRPVSAITESRPPPPMRARTGWVLLTALAALILAGLVWLATGARVPSVPGDGARVRIAVLPIANRTGDDSADYVAEGLTDEIIAGLGAISPARLGVIARTSVNTYRDTTKSVAEIGRELQVHYVLEGSMRRDGDRLRVSAELVTVTDQTQVWADSFERAAADTMSLQTDMAVRVARALALQLVPDVQSRSADRLRVPADAWDAYLQGRHWKNRGGAAAGEQALQRFEEAVRIDPTFATAWAEIADTRHFLVMIGALSPRQAYPRAIEAADRALDLNASLAAAHAARGVMALFYDWSPPQAEQALGRALSLNPSDAGAHHDYAWTMVALGRFDEAVTHMTTARDLDPLSVRANADIGWLHLHLRQPTEAARACRQTLAIDPESTDAQACLERAFEQRGLFDEAWRAARASLPPDADIVMPTGAGADARQNVRAVWQWRLMRLQNRARAGWANPYGLASLQLMLGDTASAWPNLEAAFRERVGMLAFLHTDPVLDPLRSDPRFDALAARVEAASGK
jgi:TolB-like protein/DNA-binding winged helix-turn-helix (wHTH) protein